MSRCNKVLHLTTQATDVSLVPVFILGPIKAVLATSNVAQVLT